MRAGAFFPQMPELWLSLPPFLWSLFVRQRKLTPIPSLQEAEPIRVDAGLPAPCPGPCPPCSLCTQTLWFISVMDTVVSTKECESPGLAGVSQPQRGEGSGIQEAAQAQEGCMYVV